MKNRDAEQSGYILSMALLLLVVCAIILTSVTVAISRKWNATQQELLVQQELMTYNTAVTQLDLCMTEVPSDAALVPALDTSPCNADWTTISGATNCGDGTHARCWRVAGFDPGVLKLVSGAGNRDVAEARIQIAVGCIGAVVMERDCDRLGLIKRRYYRNTFLQYQLHYDIQELSPRALQAVRGVFQEVIDPVVAFVTGDIFNGPVRLNTTQIFYCGTPGPSFGASVSILGHVDPAFVEHDSCVSGGGPPTVDLERVTVPLSVDEVDCSSVLPVHESDGIGWADEQSSILDSASEVNIISVNPLPKDVSSHPAKVIKYDMPHPDDADAAAPFTVYGVLQSGQSVTVVATGDIIVSDDLNAPDGLISLVSQCGDVLLEPDLAGAGCLDITHSITLHNVAILTPNGSMWMQDWDKPICPDGSAPTFKLVGSVASEYMGLHGIADDQGEPRTGWNRVFIYPEYFWLQRPVWWPKMTQGEWLPTETVATAGLPPQSDLLVVPSVVTVTEGSTATAMFEVRLTTPPSGNVTVATLLAPSSALVVTPATMTFAPADWSRSQVVTVDAAAYQDADTTVTTFQVELTTMSSDSLYNSLTTQVDVLVNDDDSPGLLLAPTFLLVDEGADATFTVRLTTAPSADVSLSLMSDNTSAATIAPATWMFTTSDWAIEQTITVTGVNDSDANDETLAVLLAAMSADSDYVGKTASIPVTVTDDDTPALVVAPSSVAVAENATATFDVSLASQPTGPVVVGVSSGDTAVATVNPPSLTFTDTNWNTDQVVTITGADDADFDDDNTSIELNSTSIDTDYNGITAAVQVDVTDVDAAGAELVISPDEIVIPDDSGHGRQFNVSLSVAPSADVSVTIASAPATLYFSPSQTLTFTPANWATPQQVGMNDGGNSGEAETTLTLTGSLGGYDGVTGEVLVYIVDDEDTNATHPILGVPIAESFSAPSSPRPLQQAANRLICDVPNGTATLRWRSPGGSSPPVAGYEVTSTDTIGTSSTAITADKTATLDFVPQGTLTVTLTAFNFNSDDLARQDSSPLISDLTC